MMRALASVLSAGCLASQTEGREGDETSVKRLPRWWERAKRWRGFNIMIRALVSVLVDTEGIKTIIGYWYTLEQ